MTNGTKMKPPVWFWVVSVLALIWNLMGAFNYLMQAYMTDEMKAELPEDQLALMESTPSWVTAAFAIAVWGGVLGCIALLLRKKWAKPVLLISLIGILAQMSYSFFMSNSMEVYGTTATVMSIIVIIIGIALVYFARGAHNRGWIS
jgi:CHASE2 domain-containing sensor protein